MTASKTRQTFILSAGLCLGAVLLCGGIWPSVLLAEDATVATVIQDDARQALEKKREQSRAELEGLGKNLQLSQQKSRELEESIKTLDKSVGAMRQAMVETAARRKALERQVADGGQKLADLRTREDKVKASLKERRGLLAEVLAALQRMGRNPPPALLVEPEDALSSVRSAILLGAVVPGIRKETEKLAASLAELNTLSASIAEERASLTRLLAAGLEEDKRLALLIEENSRRTAENTAALQAERARSEKLASEATSMQGLIDSLGKDIDAAAAAAKAEEQRLASLNPEEQAKARADSEKGLPDKNRIAPAYPFSKLTGKLELPVGGKLLRSFGDMDPTGHASLGVALASDAGRLVTAPADGTVIFSGKFRSYGEVVILDPGDGFLMLLSGMDKIHVQKGQFVVAGEPVAVMGEKRTASATALALETDRPTLYIELWKDGKPVDSRPWWSATEFGRAQHDT